MCYHIYIDENAQNREDFTMMKGQTGEEAIRGFRALYRSYGYRRYKMSKFEAYDLYVENKNFLASERIVTFPGVGGRLMALRPDVTLSIVKNAAAGEGEIEKLYYNETVYRTEDDELREITQVGLECIGRLDDYAMGEVVLLAARSLALVDEDYLLTLSHMGIVSALLDAAIPADEHPGLREKLLSCIGEKNAHGLRALCAEAGVEPAAAERLAALTQLGGGFDDAVEDLRTLCAESAEAMAGLGELESISRMLALYGTASHLRLDFSLVNDLQYYNGVIFKGYLRALPCELLSGGRYDRLARRFGREGAIGFGINVDLLERLGEAGDEYDVDVLLCYDVSVDADALIRAVKMLCESGQSVRVQAAGAPVKLKFRQRLNLREGGLEIGE